MSAIYILLILYWGNDGRSAMTSVEFSSRETCEAAIAASDKVMGGFSGRPYSVCVKK